MSKISKRLKTIADNVSGKIVCDVGCDHGLLAEYMLDNGIVDFAYVSDISMPSLKKAEILLASKYSSKFKSICTDGLLGYKGIDNIEECIISGMGGNEIINIIKNSPIDIDTYILSPQHNIIETKKFVLSHGYDITYDIIIKDKQKFYTIFKCSKSNHVKNYTDYELLIGRNNFTDKLSDIKEYVDYELNKLSLLIERVDNNTRNEILERSKLLNEAKKELKEYE